MPKPPLIAIVEDDAAVREALFDLLQVEGLAARTFEGAAEFLDAAAPQDFDCIVTDVRMPAIGGLELQQRLRACGAAIPVIFITSLEDEALRMRALDAGAAGWFTKPVSDDALLRAIRGVLAGNAD